MLDVEVIFDDNMEKYMGLLGEDISEDMKREFYRAYGVVGDDSAEGVIVYELCNFDNEDEDTKSRIRWLKSDNDEALDLLHKTYKEEGVFGEEIKESSYWLSEEKSAASCERAGFSKEVKEDETVTMTLEDALEIPYVAKAKKLPEYICGIDKLSVEQFRTAIKDALFSGKKGALEDIGYLQKEWFENSVSACTITDNKVNGLFLIRKTASGIMEPVLLEASGPDSERHLAWMIAYAIKKGQELYPPETTIRIRRSRKEITALVGKLFPKVKGKEAFFGTRKEE